VKIVDGRIILERGKTYELDTGKLHKFTHPVDYMTISVLLPPDTPVSAAFPRYVLESTDGAYKRELSPAADFVPHDDHLQLRFEALLPDKKYTLTRFYTPTYSEVVFHDRPFADVIDQERPAQKDLHEHGHPALEMTDGDTLPVTDWDTSAAG
jgi:hypothetical protein